MTDLSAPYVDPSETAQTESADGPSLPTDKEDLRVYWHHRNARSIDGLPSLGTLLFPPEQETAPERPTGTACASSTKPSTSATRPSRFARLPSLQTVGTHVVVGSLAGGAVYAIDHGWLGSDAVKMGLGLAGATAAWIGGTMVGVPVPAPCCAMGM